MASSIADAPKPAIVPDARANDGMATPSGDLKTVAEVFTVLTCFRATGVDNVWALRVRQLELVPSAERVWCCDECERGGLDGLEGGCEGEVVWLKVHLL